MQVKPDQWTHHHTHRLFHISIGLCFAFAALTIIIGMITVWFNVSAGTISLSNNLTVTATVAGISPGPIVPSPGGGTNPSPPVANPTVTIRAEPAGQVPQQPITVGSQTKQAYVFSTPYPAFSGHTSLNNALVFLSIQGDYPFYSTATASAQGDWLWQSPIQMSPGTYFITATVYSNRDSSKYGSASAYFIVQNGKVAPVNPGPPQSPLPSYPSHGSSGSGSAPSYGTSPSGIGSSTPPSGSASGSSGPGSSGSGSGGQQSGISGSPTGGAYSDPSGGGLTTGTGNTTPNLFGIFFDILPEYKRITAGNKIVAAATLVSNYNNKEISNQQISYVVKNPTGLIVMESTDTVSFSQQSRFLKTFLTARGTTPGLYTIIATSTFQGIVSTASATFYLDPAVNDAVIESTTPAPQGPVILWSVLLFLLLLFLALAFVAYHQVKMLSSAIKKDNDHQFQKKDLV